MKRLKRILLVLVVLILVLWGVGWLLLQSWYAKAPPLPANASEILQQKVVTRDGKQWLGKCWYAEREGLPVIYLTGSPFEMGYASGRLMKDRMLRLEEEAIAMARRYVPREWALTLIKDYVVYRNRHLPEFVKPAWQMELLGMTYGCPDIHPEIGPYFARVMNYHAAHDISYMLIDNPLVTGTGCTAFGAWGHATANGHLLSGRNFDWEADPIFDHERVMILCEPDEGVPFVSLAWAGMVGVVSGMNRAGVSVTVNGAPSDLPREVGTPAALVARDILQHSHNLQEATTILSNSHVFVSTLWLIGSRSDNKFVVVEKTPELTHLREPQGDEIVCANHFQTDELKDASRNLTFSNESTSVNRYIRLQELLTHSQGSLTISQTVDILRDRRLTGDRFVGNGNRSTLNAYIATHSTAMDLTEGIFWASTTPHQLGKFVAFDVADFNRLLPDRALPADPAIASQELAHYETSQACLKEGHADLKKGDAEKTLELARKAEALNPGFYENAFLEGRALLRLGRRNEAAKAFTTALSESPSFAKERRELENLLQQAQAQP